MKHVFMLSILFKSHLIRHSGMGCAFKDTQKALEHLRYSESTRAFGHLESTQRALEHSGTRRALGDSEGNRALRHLRHLGTRTFRALRHSDTWELRALRHLGTRALEALYLGDSAFLRNFQIPQST